MKYNLSESRIFIILLLYVTVVLFFISPDSYTHDLYARCDSAWFFMCGKAWMNGLLPYQDFADSKGPLLWLIYGIGYLIDHYSYIGIYWLSCITYSITFFICYKVAYLLSANKKYALLATLSMILPYYLHWFHYEIRSEDFCHPFLIAGIYYLLQSGIHPTQRNFRRGGFILGIGISACLLIKWSIAIMFMTFVISVGILAYKNKLFKSYSLFFLLGSVLLLLPFILYFVNKGLMSDLIQEYFINTYTTVHYAPGRLIVIYIYEWILTITSEKLIYFLYLGGIYIWYKRKKEITILPFLCCLFLFSFSIHHDFGYYTTVLSSFAIFMMLLIIEKLNKYTAIPFILFILAFQVRNIKMKNNLFFEEYERRDYYTAAYFVSQVKNPTIINEGYEIGIGLPSNTLPATRYWSRQNGETNAMEYSRHQAIKEGKADFVTYTVRPMREQDPYFIRMLKDAGYVYYCSVHSEDGKVSLYGKKGLKYPDESFHVSNMDILCKRKLF